MSYPRVMLLAIVVSLIWSSVPATAQPLGVFRWQLLPYCNVITLNVTQQNGVYTLDGTEDRCGASQAASAAGIAFLNPNGTVGFGMSTVLPGGAPLHLEAAITLPSLGGTWRDSAGNNGTLLFITGAGSGGAPRPVASAGIPDGSITAVQLANGAVGSSALAANSVTSAHIVDGTVTSADLATGAVGALVIAADSINGSHIVDGSITGADLANGAVGAAVLAANSVTGAHIVDGSVTGVDLANGTVGSAALGANSVNGGHVVDGSLTIADIGDAPRLLPSVELPGTVVDLAHLVDEIVLEITVVAPAAGRVLLNASGAFAFDNLSTVDQGFCSLTTGTVVAPPYAGVAFEGSAAGFRRAPFGGTRVFSVAAGSSTFRLVCVAQGSNLGIADPVLTALFVAGS